MIPLTENFLQKLSSSKIIVILRNIEFYQIEEYVDLLEKNEFNTIEVTLNSPDPFKSIEFIAKKFPNINLGAGTVVKKKDVVKLLDLGVKFIVSPNTDPEIITESLKNQIIPIPGFYTATEGLNAIKYGASILKLFPAGLNGLNLLKDYSSIFPQTTKFIPTGGINTNNIKDFLTNASGVGVGSSLFSNEISLIEFSKRIQKFKQVLDL